MQTDLNQARINSWSRGPDYPFPPPWFWPQCFEHHEFLPIDTCAELYAESLAMRHCAGAWARIVSAGYYCTVSIRQNGCRIATAMIEISRTRIGEFGPPLMVRGYKNREVPEIEKIVRDWLLWLAAGG